MDNNNLLTQITSNNLTFTATPTISISSNLTKILVYGLNSTTSLQAYLYYVDYSGLSIQSLTYPYESIYDATNYFAIVEDDWLYARQLKSANQTAANGTNLEQVYYILYNTIIEDAEDRPITTSD